MLCTKETEPAQCILCFHDWCSTSAICLWTHTILIMAPVQLDTAYYTGDHAENCRKARSRLTQLNPGHNVFIYWSRIQTPITKRMRDMTSGTFGSQADNGWFTKRWSYGYLVFKEGLISWDGSRGSVRNPTSSQVCRCCFLTNSSDDKLCLTDGNHEVTGDDYRFQDLSRK